MQSIYKYSSPKCFSQFQCSQRLSVHQHSMVFVLNVVVMWSLISSNNVLLSDLQPCCSMASMFSRRRLFLQLVWQVFDSRVFRSSLLVVTYHLDLSVTMKMRKLCEINEKSKISIITTAVSVP